MVTAVTTATFQKLVLEASRQHPVLVDFWAAWCGPCRALAPVLERVAPDYAGRASIVKLNTDEEPSIAATYGIKSLPTVALFKDGQRVDGFIGAQPESVIRQTLDRHVRRSTAASAGTGEASANVLAEAARARLQRSALKTGGMGSPEALEAEAARHFLSGRHQDGLDAFLLLLQHYPQHQSSAGLANGRVCLVDAFTLLGEEHDLVGRYRRRMAAVLG